MWEPTEFTRKALSGLIRSASVRLAAAIAGLIVFSSFVSYWIGLWSDTSDAVTWAVWLFERANTPWLGVFALVLISVLFWLGVRSVERKIAKAEAEAGGTLKEQRRLFNEATQIPREMAHLMALQNARMTLAAQIGEAERFVRAFEKEAQRWLSDKEFRFFVEQKNELAICSRAARDRLAVEETTIRPLRASAFRPQKHVLMPTHGDLDENGYTLFLPDANAALQASLKAEQRELNRWLGLLRQDLKQADLLIEKQGKTIRQLGLEGYASDG